MIQINLLPQEYRKPESTPIARFIAIVAGAVLVTTGLVVYGYVHYSKLKSAKEVREATEHEYSNKKALADDSQALQSEINAYEARRKTIQQVARARILWSRKLDEFVDIIHNRGDKTKYFVWLKSLRVAPPRVVRRGRKAQSGGSFSFSGFSAGAEFRKIANLRRAIRSDPFYEDFQSITLPHYEEKVFDDGREPSSAGIFDFNLKLKPLGWRRTAKRKK